MKCEAERPSVNRHYFINEGIISGIYSSSTALTRKRLNNSLSCDPRLRDSCHFVTGLPRRKHPTSRETKFNSHSSAEIQAEMEFYGFWGSGLGFLSHPCFLWCCFSAALSTESSEMKENPTGKSVCPTCDSFLALGSVPSSCCVREHICALGVVSCRSIHALRGIPLGFLLVAKNRG